MTHGKYTRRLPSPPPPPPYTLLSTMLSFYICWTCFPNRCQAPITLSMAGVCIRCDIRSISICEHNEKNSIQERKKQKTKKEKNPQKKNQHKKQQTKTTNNNNNNKPHITYIHTQTHKKDPSPKTTTPPPPPQLFDDPVWDSTVHSYGMKEGNLLFSAAFNTFYLRLYIAGHMVKDHSERVGPLEMKPAAVTSWATVSD